MSEYYKIIEKIERISTRRYCVHGAPYCFSGFFLASQAYFNTMCFSFAAKMAADTNQLKEVREFLRAENEDSAKRLIQTLNPSCIVYRQPKASRKASRK